jgi:uncharacterized protein YuzE
MKERLLKGKGEWDYDYRYDTLFFKVKDRKYRNSLEMGNLVVDIDSENFVVGLQIFSASKFLGIPKLHLREDVQFQLNAKIDKGIIQVSLAFNIKIRNHIIQKNPIFVQPNTEGLPNSQLLCKTNNCTFVPSM